VAGEAQASPAICFGGTTLCRRDASPRSGDEPVRSKTVKALKAFVAVLIFLSSFLSHSLPARFLSACAQPQEGLAVSLDNSQHSIGQPAPGKALIYFIQDTEQTVILMYPIVKIGIDGKIVGANMWDSYFAVAVEPGWHDLCTGVQSPFTGGDPEFDHLIAEPGKVYYFRIRLFFAASPAEFSSLAPIDGDEAIYLIASYPLATAYAPNGSEPGAVRRRSAAGRGRSAPALQLALNSAQEKTVRSGSEKKPASGVHRDPGKSPGNGRDASSRTTGSNATPRTK
jgi:hypothetical protein